MAGVDKIQGMQPRWRVFLTLLCVVLILFVGALQAVHSHPVGDATHADCSLCVAAHVVAQVVDAPVAAPAMEIAPWVEAILHAVPPVEPATFALSIRPPPDDALLA
jgi:hypothetical protein